MPAPGSSTLAVITTTSVVCGSVSASALSSMNRLCGERMATSLRYGLVRPRLSAVTRWTVSRLNCSRCSWCSPPRRRRWSYSVTVKIARNTPAKHEPADRGHRLGHQVGQRRQRTRSRKTRPRPIGHVHVADSGCSRARRNSRGPRFLNRSTTIDSVLNTKLHTTPKA